MKKILLISGKQGAGKTSNCEVIFRQCLDIGYEPKVFKFADVIYKMHDACLPILKVCGVRPEEMKKDGELLQVLGTEYGRKCLGENIWVTSCRLRVDWYLNALPFDAPHGTDSEANQKYLDSVRDKRLAIIDDCRFENEFDAFPDAFRIRMQADEETRKARCKSWRDNTGHASETGLDKYEAEKKFDFVADTALFPLEHVALQTRIAWFQS